ncbi:unnamed protein product [Rhodiola kirilowii]
MSSKQNTTMDYLWSSASSSDPCKIIGKQGILVCYLFLIFSCIGVRSIVLDIPESQKFPALLVFGDSIVDPGNNNGMVTPSRADYPPYGQDFQGGKATGRFSNGKLPTDFIAEELSIKEYLPAYLDESLQSTDLLTGVSFASGGCGYDPLSAVYGVARTLSQQLDQFKEYKAKLNSVVGENETSRILSRSLFMIVAGSNDIANTFYGPTIRRSQYDINSYTDFMSSSASDFTMNLYGLGARRIGVLSAPPLGCVPSQRTIAGGVERKCVESLNQASLLFNSKLSSVVNSFNNNNKDARAEVLDIFNPVMELVQNPEKNGFEVVDKGCCGTGEIEVTFLCSELYHVKTCSDPTKYVFWDTFHPTQTAYKLLAARIISSAIPKLYLDP